MKYVQDGPDGEWFPVTLKHGVRQMCCGCSLVHTLEFRRRGRCLEMRFVRHERATAAARRARKKTVVIADD